MNASERKALAAIQDRASAGPWATTHVDAATAAGLSLSAWKRALPGLEFARLVTRNGSRGHGLTLSLGPPQSSPDEAAKVAKVMTQRLASVAKVAKFTSQGSQSSATTGPCLARSFETTSLLVVGSKEETTNDEQTTVVEQTARDTQGSQSSPAKAAKFTPQSSPTDLCGRALDYAERCGRLEAENAHLRERLARLETTCTTPAPLPTPSTSAPVVGTRGSATTSPETGPTSVPPLSSTSSGSTWTPTVTPTAPGIEPRPSAPPSPPVALHPANYRGEILTPLEPGTDPHEDERVFREVICKDAGVTSEMAQDVELMRLRKDFSTFHRAVASYVLAVARKDKPRKPLGYLATSVGLGAVPGGFGEEGAVASWNEINKTWLPRAKANPKKRSPAEEKAEAERLAAEDQERCRVIAEAKWAAEAERERKQLEEWNAQESIRAELEAKNKARLVAQFTGEVEK